MNVGHLKDILKNIPDDTEVYARYQEDDEVREVKKFLILKVYYSGFFNDYSLSFNENIENDTLDKIHYKSFIIQHM